jgi:hypothetical protein
MSASAWGYLQVDVDEPLKWIMTNRVHSAVVAEFLQNALAGDALRVPKLEAMARTAGLLGEGHASRMRRCSKRAQPPAGSM